MATKTKAVVKESLATAFDRGICYQFTFGMPSFRAKADKDKIETGDADKAMMTFGKKLLECEQYDSIKTLYGDIKKYLEPRSIRTNLRESFYLVPIDLTQEVEDQMAVFETELGTRVAKLIEVYKAAKADAKKRLGKQYDESDYPAESTLSSRFYMEFEPKEIDTVPGRLKGINQKLYEKHNVKLAKQREEAGQFLRDSVRQVVLEMTKHLHERLDGTDENGRPKVFRASAIEHIEQFLQFYDKKDVTNDVELGGEIKKLRQLMKGVDVESLRDDQKFRARIAGELKGVTDSIEKLVTGSSGRRIKIAQPTQEVSA